MELITTEELRKKEVIDICNGAQLGYACDFQFDKCTAQITGLILEKNCGFLGLGGGESLFLPWCRIECIGEDTILVRLDGEKGNSFSEIRKKKKFWDFK